MSVAELLRDSVRKPVNRSVGAASGRRIMFVIEALTVGGAERMVIDLANEFSSRGDYVSVVCLSTMGELAESLSADVSLFLLHKKPGVDIGVSRRLRDLVIEHEIEVVNSHLWTANLWTRLALFRSGVPVVITEHNRDVWKRGHNKLIDRALSHVTAKLIAVSEDTADFYRHDVGIRNSLVTIINNGVDTKRYAAGNGESLRSQLAGSNELLIGTVGRLAAQKNHPRLVQAAAILKAQGLPVRVVIAGDGPERASTQASIVEYDVADCVTLLGERSDIPDLLAALDVFVLSSDREGHPLSALEAQSAGTPVVLTRAGGSADAISSSADQCGGLLVDKSPEAIADAIAKLSADRPRLNAMARFASAYAAAHFDKQTMIDRYSDIFDAVRFQSTNSQSVAKAAES